MSILSKTTNAVLLGALIFSTSVVADPIVYIPLGSANKVIAVDGANDQIVASYGGVENPHGLVATRDGEYLVSGSLTETPPAAGEKNASGTSKLFLIHTAHGHVMLTIPVDGWTHHQAITPDDRYVISTHPVRGYVSVVDLQSNQVVRTIKTGPAPNYTVITRDGKRAYVSNSGDGTIAELDLGSWSVTRALDGGPGPEHLVFSADESKLYAGNPRAGTVSEISIESGKVTKSFTIGDNTHGLDIGDDGRRLFATSKAGDKLVAFEPSTGKIQEVVLSPAPYHLNAIPGTGKLYISSRKKPEIWVVDQQSLKVMGVIKLPGGEGHQMAVVSR